MYLRIKQSADIFLVILSCPLWLPVAGLVALAIKLTSPGPVLFTQTRVGRNLTHFTIFKFRTMRIDTPHDTPTHLLEDPKKHLTPIGAFLRKTSLDELPQVFNILRGELCFIGPRPALWNQYDLIAEREKYGANALLPGLTGWAQVNGRDALSIAEKAAYDGAYAQKICFRFDLKIFFLTVCQVLRGSGVREGAQGPTKDEAP